MFSSREIETLSLLSMCRDTPAEIIPIIGKGDVDLLKFFGLIRMGKNNGSIRVTPEGHTLLQKAGKDFPPDGQYRSSGAVLQRRHIAASFIFWLRLHGINTFLQTPNQTGNKSAFLPSFALRRQKGRNMLGASRFIGILYSEKNAFGCYYVTDNNDGIYADFEQRTISSEYLNCRKKAAVLFTGKEDFNKLFEVCKTGKNTESSADSYYAAAQRFTCGVSFVPLSDDGFRQLRILCVKNYKKLLLDAVLPNNWEPAKSREYDAVRKDCGDKYLIAIDGNLVRPANITEESVHVILLSEHMKTAQRILKGKKLLLHPVELLEIERLICGAKEFPHTPMPYITKEGEYLNAPVKAFGKSRK